VSGHGSGRGGLFCYETATTPHARAGIYVGMGEPSGVVLIVEDDVDCARLFETVLAEADLESFSVGTIAEARERIATPSLDLVLLDIGLPDGSGLSLIDEIVRLGDDAPTVVVVSGFAGDSVARALAGGARDFLAKPFQTVELTARVRAALDERRSRREARSARAEAEQRRAELEAEVAEHARTGAALRLSEERYRRIVEDAPDVVYRWDVWPSVRLSYWSQAGERLTGYSIDDLADEGLLNLIHPDDHHIARARLEAMGRGEHTSSRPTPIRWVTRDGRTLWMETRSVPMHDECGRLVAVEGIGRDVTERVRTEEMLRFQAHLLNCVEQAIAVTDLDGRISYWNSFAERLYGWTAGEALGRNLIQLLSGEPWPAGLARKLARLQAGERSLREVELRRRDGTCFVGMIQTTPRRDDSGRLVGTIVVSFDVTARRLAEEERERLSDEVLLLEERHRIAMELHDGALQSLYGVSLSLSAADRAGATTGAWPSDAVRSAVSEIVGVMAAVRGYVYGLRSESTAVTGLESALGAVALRMRACGIDVELELDACVEARLAPEAVADLLQIAREASSNVLRHAGARHASLRLALARGRDAVELAVIDDGGGFDPRRATASAGSGLGSMLDRAARMGAALSISTAPGHGTAVHLTRRLRTEIEG
jgi:PAS domain S-box-containing protein